MFGNFSWFDRDYYRTSLTRWLVLLRRNCFWIKSNASKEGEKANTTQIWQQPIAVSLSIPALARLYLSDLSPLAQKDLNSLLAQAVGIGAPLLIERGIKQSMTGEQFLNSLNHYIPARSPTWNQIEALLQKDLLQFQVTDRVKEIQLKPVQKNSTEELNPVFVAACISSLENAIGPIALLLIQRHIAHNPSISQLQLVNALAKTIPDRQLAQKFLSRFFLKDP
jgi:hypothetical protein